MPDNRPTPPRLRSWIGLLGALALSCGWFPAAAGSIGDTVFEDVNVNSVYDAGVDIPLANLTVDLYTDTDVNGVPDGPAVATASTGPAGDYLFPGLADGRYLVYVDQTDPHIPFGFTATEGAYLVVLAGGGSNLDADFPFTTALSKFVDKTSVNPAGTTGERTLTYTIIPNYAGDDLLTAARISDPIPTGTTYVANSVSPGSDAGNVVTTGATSGTITRAIDRSTDDAEEEGPTGVFGGPGYMYLNSSDLELVNDAQAPAPGNQKVGLRFNSLAIPPGSVISSAKLVFRAIQADSPNVNNGPTSLSIKGLAADNSATFTPTDYDLSSRPVTAASVAWSPTSWSDGVSYDSPDLATIVQEIVNRPGWAINNSLAFVITGTGSRSAESWDNSGNTPPRLVIDYTFSGVSTEVGWDLGSNSAAVDGTYFVDSSSSATLHPVEDAYVSEESKKTNYGTATDLQVGEEGKKKRYSYLKFDLSSIPGGSTISGATFGMKKYGGDNKSASLNIHRVTGNWTEAGVTWDNKPAYNSTAVATTKVGANGNYTWNVASLVEDWYSGTANQGLAVIAANEKAKLFYAEEQSGTADDPYLTVSYVGPSTKSTRVSLEASRALIGGNGPQTVTVTMTVDIADCTGAGTVTPPASLTIVNDSGATVVLTAGPSPASAVIPDSGGTATFVYTYSVSNPTAIGEIVFSGKPTSNGTGFNVPGFPSSAEFSLATSHSILISPPLTFQVVVNNGTTVNPINNTAFLEDQNILEPAVADSALTFTSGAMGDRVWHDANGDTIQDGDEPGVAGVRVFIDQDNSNTFTPGEPFALTDGTGGYLINGLSAGTYKVMVDMTTAPTAWTATTPTSLSRNLASNTSFVADADYGLRSPPGIGNLVWIDSNSNGLQDAGEPGYARALLTLKDGSGGVLATTTTDANGAYQFPNLAAGTYSVELTLPSGYRLTLIEVGSDRAQDSNPNPAPVTLVGADAREPRIDFGLVPGNEHCSPTALTCVSGAIGRLVVTTDANGNVTARYEQSRGLNDNTYGANAVGWPNGHTFGHLTGSDKATFTFYDAAGNVAASFVLDYITSTTITPTTPSGYASLGAFGGDGSWIAGNQSHLLRWDTSMDYNLNDLGLCVNGTCTSGGTDLEVNSPPCDVNYNVTNPVYAGWDFTNWYEATVSASAFAAGGGFDHVEIGTIHNSPPKCGSNAVDPVPCTDSSCTGVIGDFVWFDMDADGLQGSTEPGIPGVPVILKNSSGQVIATTTTSSVGFYQFAQLCGGTYTVEVPTPSGYVPTTSLVGADRAVDSNGSPTTVVLPNNGVDLTLDFGFKSRAGCLGIIGDYVWIDADKDGLQDGGETPYPGALLTLKDAAGNVIATTTTDISGYYEFPNLCAGTYKVELTVPNGYQTTVAQVGADRTIDSNSNPATAILALDNSVDMTLDFGLVAGGGVPQCSPVTLACLGGAPAGRLFVTTEANGNVTVRYEQSRNLNDNSYGANVVNWPRTHTFANLTGSDKAQFVFYNAAGTKVADFILDYITGTTITPARPSGYASLGPDDGDGDWISGTRAHLLSWKTAMDYNLNQLGLCVNGTCTSGGVDLEVNSPPADENYVVENPIYAGWDFTIWYEMTMSAAAFGASGFGRAEVGVVHNSPPKCGENAIDPVPCDPPPPGGMDLGDLPDPTSGAGARDYQTLLANDGPRHTLSTLLRLGSEVDAETNGQPTAAATGDDQNPLAGPDDEDGVVLPAGFVPNTTVGIAVNVSGGSGKLNAWIDWTGDGDFADAGEQIALNTSVVPGPNFLTVTVPANAVSGFTGARFRLNAAGNLTPTGAAGDGEVEDYMVVVGTGLDFGDAPTAAQSTHPANYPTLLVDRAARHTIVAGFNLGTAIDAETDGQPHAGAIGDDLNGATPDDEDGLAFASSIKAGSLVSFVVSLNNTAGFANPRLDAWIDWNHDGDWDDANEQIFVSRPLASGANPLQFMAPAAIQFGPTFVRLRLSDGGGLPPTGAAPNGEVEDYVTITQPQGDPSLDWGDLPDAYKTLFTSNGPRHALGSGLVLGAMIDPEPDGQPTTFATGDDANPPLAPDDEDGVSIPNLTAGAVANIAITASGPGVVNAFFDWNNNNTLNDPGEAYTLVFAAAGTQNLTLTVPFDAVTSPVWLGARFRLSTAGGLTPTGAAADGEVEDYVVKVSGPPTAAELAFFRATRLGVDQIRVVWGTHQETDTIGFKLERGGGNAPWSPIHNGIIPAQGGDFHPQNYQFNESGVVAAETVTYRLSAIDRSGQTRVLAETGVRAPLSLGLEFRQGQMQIEFRGEPNGTARLETSVDAANGPWEAVEIVPLDASGAATLTREMGRSEPMRFYRIRE